MSDEEISELTEEISELTEVLEGVPAETVKHLDRVTRLVNQLRPLILYQTEANWVVDELAGDIDFLRRWLSSMRN